MMNKNKPCRGHKKTSVTSLSRDSKKIANGTRTFQKKVGYRKLSKTCDPVDVRQQKDENVHFRQKGRFTRRRKDAPDRKADIIEEEEIKIPEKDRNLKKPYIIKSFMSEDNKLELKTLFPELEFKFQGTKYKSHPVLSQVRLILEGKAIKLAKTHLKHGKILDVGTSLRTLLKLGKLGHGIERINHPNFYEKMMNVQKNNVTGHDTGQKENFDFCLGKKICQHHVFDTALFIHSLYYNSPEQIYEIINQTTSRIAYAVVHIFKGSKGKIYEAKWFRDNNEITMQVPGNCRNYIHPDMSWMDGKNFVVIKKEDGISSILAWKQVDSINSTKDKILKFFIYQMENEPELLQAKETYYNDFKKFKNDLKNNKKNVEIKLKTGIVIIPKKLVLMSLRFIISKKPTPDQLAILTNYLASHSQRKKFTGINEYDLLRAQGPLTNFIWRLYQENKLLRSGYYTTDINKELNKVIVDRFSFKTKGFNKLYLLIIPLIFIAAYIDLESESNFTFGFTLIVLFIIFFRLKFKRWYDSFMNQAYHNTPELQTMGFKLIQNLFKFKIGKKLILMLLTIFFIKKVKTSYQNWDDLKNTINVTRQSYWTPIIPVRPFDGMDEISTLFDPYSLPQSDTVQLKFIDEKGFGNITEDKVKEICDKQHKPPRKSIVNVAPAYTNLIPAVFNKTAWNEFVSLKTRVAIKPKDVCDRLYWQKIENVMDEELPLQRSNIKYSYTGNEDYYPEVKLNYKPSIFLHNTTLINDTSEFCNINVKPVSYSDYLKGFPRAKRERMEKVRIKYETKELKKSGLSYQFFIKKEKQMLISDKPYKPIKPRGINGVPVISKVTTGPWFKTYQKCMKYVWEWRNWIWFTSGATTETFKAWWKLTDQIIPVSLQNIMCSDYSTFDVTQSEPLIQSEVKYYRKLGFGFSHIAKLINKAKLKTKSYGKFFMVKMVGIRKTGDNDTTTGNSRTTAYAIASFFKMFTKNCKENVRIMIIGDDSFVVFNVQWLLKYFTNTQRMLVSFREHIVKIGLKVKVLTTENLLDSEYISCKFFRLVDGTVAIGKKPGRVLAKVGWFLNSNRSKKKWLNILKGTLISYLATVKQVPFLRSYIYEVLNYLSDVVPEFSTDLLFRLNDKKGVQIILKKINVAFVEPEDKVDWVDFQKCYGFNIQDELQFRKNLRDNLNIHGLHFIEYNPFLEILLRKEAQVEEAMK